MPPKKGGKKGKKAKKTTNDDAIKRPLVFKDISELQEYAQIMRLLGNCRCELYCIDGKTRLGHIRGNMRKKVFVKVGDIVLVSLREFEDSKCDIIYLYNKKEAVRLKACDELPNNIKINYDMVADKEETEDLGVEFKNEDDIENEYQDMKKNFEENFKVI